MSHTYTVFIVSGPAGCGKTTVAQYLSEQFQAPFVEGDSLHDETSIAKMANGIPLTDEDRGPWLLKLIPEALNRIREGKTENPNKFAFIACSALKKVYRDCLRTSARELRDRFGVSIGVRFLYLKADPEELYARVRDRQSHYMKESMVASQITTLEEPAISETDIITISVAKRSIDQVKALSKDALLKGMSL
ncbi:P-loop containing nucleoside triphosphate hydrolase protein [Dipodascopsis uninucleata]